MAKTKTRTQTLAPVPRITSKTITVGGLLRKVKRLILAEPRRLNMDSFVAMFQGEEVLGVSRKPACGTVACMAGWGAVLLRPTRISAARLDDLANWAMTDLIGFDDGYGGKSVGALFGAEGWWDEGIMPTPGTSKHAAFVARWIDGYLARHPEIVNRTIDVAEARKMLSA